MLPFPHIPDQVLFGSSGYPLRIEAGLVPQLNTPVNGRSTIFTGNKVLVAAAGESLRGRSCRRGLHRDRTPARFRGNAGTTNQRMI